MSSLKVLQDTVFSFISNPETRQFIVSKFGGKIDLGDKEQLLKILALFGITEIKERED